MGKLLLNIKDAKDIITYNENINFKISENQK